MQQGPRRLTAAARREQLLDVAVGLAAGGDLTQVSVVRIAEAASVSEGLLYHYFPTKESLLLAAVERAAERMSRALEGGLSGPPLQAVSGALGAYLDHVQADSTGWRALLQARSGPLREVARAVEDQSRTMTLALLGAPEPSAALSAAVDGWAALERQVCLDWLDRPDLGRDVVEDLLLSSLLAALQAAARHDPVAAAVLRTLQASQPEGP